ncbi:AIM24 family protein, partial [Bacillus safensis]
EREGVFEHGVSKMFKKMLSGEGTSLMKATGDGKLYVADQGKKISILRLAQGESIFVNGN